MAAPELVIFDCDGVLVDSVEIGHRVLVETARPYGFDASGAEALATLRGAKMADFIAEIERRIGGPLPQSFLPDVRARMAEAFERELRPVEGIVEALDQINVPVCVASSAPAEKMHHTLRLAGLLERFDGRIFSAYQVQCWKPDPGLFLHAAREMAAEPSRCVVVEDSAFGVRAGVAARMRVLGYAPVANETRAELEREGATVFERMTELPGLLASR